MFCLILFACIYLFNNCHFQQVVADLVCNDAFECASTSQSASTNIWCVGYRSCDSSTLTTTADLRYIYCQALYSCYDSPSISSAFGIYCYGLFSCAYGNLYSNAYTYCRAEKGCFSSIIYAYSTSHPIKGLRG